MNVGSAEIGISPLDHPETGEIQEDNDMRYRALDPCHAEYLTAMGVESSIVVPIVLEEISTGKEQASTKSSAQLWGLLACHHSESQNVTEEKLQFIQAVVDQVGVAIAQSILLNQVRSQAKQEANIKVLHKFLDEHKETIDPNSPRDLADNFIINSRDQQTNSDSVAFSGKVT